MFSPNLYKSSQRDDKPEINITIIDAKKWKTFIRCLKDYKVYQLAEQYRQHRNLQEKEGIFYSEQERIMLPYSPLLRYVNEKEGNIYFR